MQGFETSNALTVSVETNQLPAGYTTYSDFAARSETRPPVSMSIVVLGCAALILVVASVLPYDDEFGQTQRLITSRHGIQFAWMPVVAVLVFIVGRSRNSRETQAFALGCAVVPMTIAAPYWVWSVLDPGLSPIVAIQQLGFGLYLTGVAGVLAVVPLLRLIVRVSRTVDRTERVPQKLSLGLGSCAGIAAILHLMWIRELFSFLSVGVGALIVGVMTPYGVAALSNWRRSRQGAAVIAGVFSTMEVSAFVQRVLFGPLTGHSPLDRWTGIAHMAAMTAGVVIALVVLRRERGADLYKL